MTIFHVENAFQVKSVQSAYSGLRGTFSCLSTKRGCISIIKCLQFTIVPSLRASLGEALFQKAWHQNATKRRKTHNWVGTEKC